jgi:hypothetical protein
MNNSDQQHEVSRYLCVHNTSGLKLDCIFSPDPKVVIPQTSIADGP